MWVWSERCRGVGGGRWSGEWVVGGGEWGRDL